MDVAKEIRKIVAHVEDNDLDDDEYSAATKAAHDLLDALEEDDEDNEPGEEDGR